MLAVVPFLGGCSGDANPVRDIVAAVGGGPPPAETPDFVASTRPEKLDYIPVGTPDRRKTPARTADEVKAVESELDTVRSRNEAAAQAAREAGATPAPKPAETSVRRPVPATQP
ncbi:hypothetical protein [Microvirga massiliensis]|uniref:hypothetical protein n=1 Tax=Microvirga massiliensis TaxID=1033741 RepID=UPI00065FA4BB|nr:hypothetical protein [Microvirga massiliensis]